MEEQKQIELKLKLTYLSQLWHDFCEIHTRLYEFTCDEYMHLLASEIEKLDETVEVKTNLLNDIHVLDSQRTELVNEVAALLGMEKPEKLSPLLAKLKEVNEGQIAEEIEKMNLVLLDIIEKIQDQNKRNQLFLNRAILSLKDLKNSFMGKKNYTTYSSTGTAKSNHVY